MPTPTPTHTHTRLALLQARSILEGVHGEEIVLIIDEAHNIQVKTQACRGLVCHGLQGKQGMPCCLRDVHAKDM
jgi:hypothetical protein